MSKKYKEIQEANGRDLLSTQEVAKMFGRCEETIRRMCKGGQIREPYKRGTRWFLTKDQVIAAANFYGHEFRKMIEKKVESFV